MPVNMKNVIAEAFYAMARQKSVDKITVKDLVEACSISRQTFYDHFQDIMEVIEWSVGQSLERTLERSLEAETPEEALGVFIAAAREGEGMLRRLLCSQKREQVERMTVRAVETYLRRMFQWKALGLALSYADLEVTLRYCAYGIAGLLLEGGGRDAVDDRTLARQMYLLLTGKMVEHPPE